MQEYDLNVKSCRVISTNIRQNLIKTKKKKFKNGNKILKVKTN